ncbi:MAG: hypothetical protein ACREL5_08985 [Gemmatimonadales bacterium]
MTGRVVRVTGADTIAVPDARVALHRVTTGASGPIDSTHAAGDGRFAFSFNADTGAVYLVSARWDGIEYFGTPIVPPAGDDSAAVITVYDTSSAAPVRLAARHLIVSNVTADGVRDVVDLFVLDNRGSLTRVSADSTRPTWQVRLSGFAVNARPGNSGFAASAMQFSGPVFGLFAAIPPGERDVEIDYQIPPDTREFSVPVDVSAPISNVISDDRTMRVVGDFVRADTAIGGKEYARWQGRLTAGTPLILRFSNAAAPKWVVPLLVAIMAALLLGVTAWALRRTG